MARPANRAARHRARLVETRDGARDGRTRNYGMQIIARRHRDAAMPRTHHSTREARQQDMRRKK
ncbi:hypothetical protein WS83_03280 [Burkholderia sp. MSMB2042]|nr:hypothetical protein WS81_25875 [Burkholderia sp. MSMB2040]KVG96397.1 hypothetical protein WS83_03280 [Burkholderia sp. MSMB2042]